MIGSPPRTQTPERSIVRNSRIFLASIGLVSSLFVSACGSKDEPAAASCPAPFDYKAYTAPGTPGLTLTKDVAPILQASCSTLITCHGSKGATPGQDPQLGPVMTVATAAQLMTIHDALVGKPSAQATGLQYIVARDPENSYLMKKVEGRSNCETLTCVTVKGQSASLPACGDKMPAKPNEPLAPAQISIIRDWIKDGANL